MKSLLNFAEKYQQESNVNFMLNKLFVILENDGLEYQIQQSVFGCPQFFRRALYIAPNTADLSLYSLYYA